MFWVWYKNDFVEQRFCSSEQFLVCNTYIKIWTLVPPWEMFIQVYFITYPNFRIFWAHQLFILKEFRLLCKITQIYPISKMHHSHVKPWEFGLDVFWWFNVHILSFQMRYIKFWLEVKWWYKCDYVCDGRIWNLNNPVFKTIYNSSIPVAIPASSGGRTSTPFDREYDAAVDCRSKGNYSWSFNLNKQQLDYSVVKKTNHSDSANMELWFAM